MAADDNNSNPPNPQVNGDASASRASNVSSSARTNEFRAAAEASQNASDSTSVDSSLSAIADSAQAGSLQGTDGSAAAIAKKLQQVRAYIGQTTTAMEGLEQQADMDKIGQYNTLVKVLKDLKTSEAKLQTHLGSMPGGGPAAGENRVSASSQDAVPNSQSIGQVSSVTVDRVDSQPLPTLPPSNVSERLEAGMEEANQLTNRLRESVARREDLVERYRSTRERLAALKRQRRGIIQEERTVLLAQSPRESPYEDAIPGANYWNLEELNTGLRDFRALYDKVNALRTAYINRNQAMEGEGTERIDISGQLTQLDTKKTQLIAIIAQLKRLKAAKLREQGLDPEDEPQEEAVPVDPSMPISSDSTNAVNASIRDALQAANDAPPNPAAAPNPAADRPPQPDSTADAPLPPSGGGGGSVAMGLNDSPVSAVLAARAEMVAAGQELALRTQHLSNLKEELAGMKRLLESTVNKKNAMAQAAANEGQSSDVAGSSQLSTSSPGGDSSSPSDAPQEGERAGEFVTGVSGNVIHLSDLERQDPAVIQKYKQLSEAKQRMAQMEEIMKIIQASRGSGRPLSELLTPHQLQLLQTAQAEDEDGPITPRRAPAPAPETSEARSPMPVASSSSQPAPPPSLADLAEVSTKPNQPSGRAEGPLTAMQQQLTKNQPSVPTVNEGNSYRRPKLQTDKQERWESGNASEDPRVTEIVTLQEELKQKKNALEALMRGMGKPSFLHPDNISDNFSEGGSVPPSPQRRRERSVDPPFDRLPQHLGAAALQANNLLTASTDGRSVRPKHIRESVGPNADNYLSNNLGRPSSQQTLSDALNQLSTMQGSINSLYDALRSEQYGRQAPSPAPLPPKQQAPPKPQQQLQQQLHMQQQHPFSMFGVPQTPPMLPGMDMMTVPMLSASLQQCFSQLYLHSLEIQSLNKHIQVRQQQHMQQMMLLFMQMQSSPPSLYGQWGTALNPFGGMFDNPLARALPPMDSYSYGAPEEIDENASKHDPKNLKTRRRE